MKKLNTIIAGILIFGLLIMNGEINAQEIQNINKIIKTELKLSCDNLYYENMRFEKAATEYKTKILIRVAYNDENKKESKDATYMVPKSANELQFYHRKNPGLFDRKTHSAYYMSVFMYENENDKCPYKRIYEAVKHVERNANTIGQKIISIDRVRDLNVEHLREIKGCPKIPVLKKNKGVKI